MAKKDDSNKLITIVLAIVICLAAIVIIFVNLPQDNATIEDNNDDTTEELEEETILTITYGDIINEYKLSNLESYKSISGNGRYIKTKLLPDEVLIKGPWDYIGVEVSTLLSEIENLPESYNITVIASDGWEKIYTKDTVNGIVNSYNETGNITDEGTAKMILAYKEDLEYISEDDGGPLKVAFVGDGIITDSNLWSKYVTTIEIVEV
jgi:hypothetical protein